MTHRIYSILIAILASTVFAGCGFVDIDTPGMVNDERMYEDEQGFRDALTGIYATMAKPALYGNKLSFGFIDEIAQLYYNDNEAAQTPLTKTYDLQYRDVDVRKQIDQIWERAFFAVYSINSMLKHIDTESFPNARYYKAEGLALRAMLHFDMLRLFGRNANETSSLAIPYVTVAGNQPTERLTVGECAERIVADLEEADAIMQNAADAERCNDVLYMNRFAVKALLARVCNWMGEKEKAAEYAQSVIDGKYKLAEEEEVLQLFMGYSAKSECIWALNTTKAIFDVKQLFYPARSTSSCNMVRNNYREIFKTSTFTAVNNDYRFQAYFTQTDWGRPITAFTKLYDKHFDEKQQWEKDRVPGINMIRLPEMYYILAECLYEKNPQGSLDALNTVITARGLQPLKLTDISTGEAFRRCLMDEITKEYWGEGQIFFAHKHLQLPMNGLNGKYFAVSDETFVLPLPDSEIKD